MTEVPLFVSAIMLLFATLCDLMRYDPSTILSLEHPNIRYSGNPEHHLPSLNHR